MASPSIAAFFNVRKRAAADDLLNTRRKVSRLDDDSTVQQQLLKEKLGEETNNASIINQPTIFANAPNSTKAKLVEKKSQRRVLKRNVETDKGKSLQPKIVKFTLAGTLSPKKKNADSPNAFQLKSTNSRDSSPAANGEQARSSKPSTNASSKANAISEALAVTKKDLSFDEIKTKVSRSSKLQELKEILAKRKQLEEQLQACVQKRNGKLRSDAVSAEKPEGHALKKFDTIELEVLSRLVRKCVVTWRYFSSINGSTVSTWRMHLYIERVIKMKTARIHRNSFTWQTVNICYSMLFTSKNTIVCS